MKRSYTPIQVNGEDTFAYRIQNNILFFRMLPAYNKALLAQKDNLRNHCGKST